MAVTREQACHAIYDRLNSTETYKPGSVSSFCDWTLQAGDIVTVSQDGVTHDLPVYNLDMTWNGSSIVNLQATGNETRDQVSKGTKYSRATFSQTRANKTQIDAFESAFSNTQKELTSVKTHVTTLLDTTGKLSQRMSTAESSITQTAEAITTKVSYTDFNGAAIVSQINQSADEVKISAEKIVLDGYVTLTDLQLQVASAVQALTAQLHVGQLYIEDTIQGDFWVQGLEAGQVSFGTHHHVLQGTVNTDGTITLQIQQVVGSSSTQDSFTFNIADTKTYRDGVSAAKNSVTVGNPYIDNLPTYDSSTKKYSFPVVADASNGKYGRAMLSIDATAAYEAGQAAGGGGKIGSSLLSIDEKQITTAYNSTYYTYTTKTMSVYEIAAGCQLGIRSPSGTFSTITTNSTTGKMWISHGSIYVESQGQSKPSEKLVTGSVQHSIFYYPFSNP